MAPFHSLAASPDLSDHTGFDRRPACERIRMRFTQGIVFTLVLGCGTAVPSAASAQDNGANPKLADLPVTGHADPRLAPFDRLMTAFVEKHHVPGAALAVTRHGCLVYARGFGFADREKQEPVQPDSLFRIASVSKPLTAVAVLQLVERGKLQLTDRVFDVLKPSRSAGQTDPRLKEITVLHVLQHRGGWDRDKSFDPMFRSVLIAGTFNALPPARPGQIIRYMMSQRLDFNP